MIWTAEQILHGKCEVCNLDLTVVMEDGQPFVVCQDNKEHLHELTTMPVAVELDDILDIFDTDMGLYEERVMENAYEMGFGTD